MSQKQKVLLLSLLLLATISLTVLAVRLIDQANNQALIDKLLGSEAEATQYQATVNSIYATNTAVAAHAAQTATARAK